jgi:2'-deoxynucleoside 5'-phosphate N-hydrolase
MKIYFSGSIRGGRKNSVLYAQVIDFLKQYGEVLTHHVGDNYIEKKDSQITDKNIHDRDLRWLSEADVVIAEVSTPSLGVGYEIGRAVEAGKPILCMYNNRADFELSAMISGCKELEVLCYDHLTETFPEIEKFLSRLNDFHRTF